MKNNKWPRHTLLLIAVIATWLQTYYTYRTAFDLDIENGMQEFILLINPLAFLLGVYGISLFFKSAKGRNAYIITVKVILTIVLYGNVVFYRFYNDFITLPVLFQTNNFGDLGSSVAGLVSLADMLYFADLLIVIAAVLFLPAAKDFNRMANNRRNTYFALTFALLFLNLGLAEKERPQLLTRSFDRELLVKNIGTYNYHLYDIYVQSKTHAQKAFADGGELTTIVNDAKSNEVKPNKDFYGIAEGKNVIFISLESTQNFVINEKMNGQTITPFLNKLIKSKDTLYFDNFYHQTGLGKTSDSEFIMENSLYGIGGGAVFFTNAGNSLNSMSEKLGDNGYATSVLHANNKSFWNRDLMYQAMNIQTFYDLESFDVNEQNSVNWGLKDIPFMKQSVDIMKDMEQPFATRMLTLTNHFPFTSDKKDQYIDAYDSGDKTVDRYFQTTRYTDEAVKVLFKKLKKEGLYDNTIVVMYGDHYGISENHNKAMAKFLNKEEITPYDTAMLQEVPFIIHAPNTGIKEKAGNQAHEVGGQVDIRPTVLHLLGLDTSNDIQVGTDLLAKKHEDIIAFRDGRFITNDVVYANETFYDRKTGEVLPESAELKALIERANAKTALSDKIINGDLFRFYDEKTGIVKE
ncbi:LTA synthase family protein [Kurthia huakuii]|uniref:LTA synthase family protein n=1 Tax=Kurthia huakuii TaxID=1421019 RepID=UPI0004975534|nr:LTA synthase family protein [Kurthia huakuii]MBM7698147.1 phosphoglycerol transferase MdoB-like AlkP superfamily enzyme [Kurthia huakuii]